MMSDFWVVLRWWGTLFFVGAIAYPLTKRLFSSWWDHGYLFAKAVGMVVVTYIVYICGIYHIAPFTVATILGSMTATFVLGALIQSASVSGNTRTSKEILGQYAREFMYLGREEILFFLVLLFWTWVKAHEPSIHALEKYMDYGFTKSILNSTFFPAPDMWYAGHTINYYYFGHTVMALLTRLSGIDLSRTFNLMLATLCACTLTMSGSIAYQLLGHIEKIPAWLRMIGTAVTAYIVTFGGNLQTIYAFTKGYTGDNPPAFWTLLWKFSELGQIGQGLDRYWYANATRFIPYTIHEFPSYSFVVSDLHGHVLSLPFVLLAVALLVEFFVSHYGREKQTLLSYYGPFVFYGLLVAVLLMTNALDGPIYGGLFILMVLVSTTKTPVWSGDWWQEKGWMVAVMGLSAALASVPFLQHFSSFVTGVAINCPPAALANHKIGIFLFEGVEKCQHSPIWMMALLWGFFIYCGGWLMLRIFNFQFSIFSKPKKFIVNTKITQLHRLFAVIFFFCLGLIIFPEFFYFKDIYPMHFRSNTMFKLGYQAFIMFGLISGYSLTWAASRVVAAAKKRARADRIFLICALPLLFLVVIYPLFSVRSYFNSLKNYESIYGLGWLSAQYPDDFAAIQFLNSRIVPGSQDVLVEADGDSYTDYNHFSAFTGIPTIEGWAVHEWLWRGSYDVVAPRRQEVATIYQSDDISLTRQILKKYGVTYIIVGTLEYQKYPTLSLTKFSELGALVFSQGQTRIYAINPNSY